MEKSVARLRGLKVDICSMAECLKIANTLCGQVITINPEMIEYAQGKPEFIKILNEAELTIPDGIGVTLALLINGIKTHRVRGIEFAYNLLCAAAASNKSVALIGAKENILQWTCKNLQKKISNLNIVYAQNGYYEDENEVINSLREVQPRILLVATGSPKQEELIYKLKPVLPNTLMVGVGGSFDVWSGAVRRAPAVFQKLGLEWLYRLLTNPERIRRIFPTIPLFLYYVLKEKAEDVRKRRNQTT